MERAEKEIQEMIEGVAGSAPGFALYRLPWAEKCHLVLQTSGRAEETGGIDGLNGKRGFVMAPFRETDAHPLILIRPDIKAYGWEEIGQALKALLSDPESDSSEQTEVEGGKDDAESTVSASGNRREEEKEAYMEAFNRFIGPLQERRFQKLVLSRSTSVRLRKGFSPLNAFVQACNSYPRMMIYLCHTPASGTWMGSTPEILLSGQGKEWHTVALAGTMPMGKDETLPTEWSEKNRQEQKCVSGYVRQVIGRFGNEVTEEGPYTARAGQLVHLKTDFRFRLESTERLGDLLQELHPTPAVCGLPKNETFRFISEHEGHDRRYYSGFIGLLEPEGQTDLYVNLRCMEIDRETATLHAGGGILSCSEGEEEWEETEEKMKTILKVISF